MYTVHVCSVACTRCKLSLLHRVTFEHVYVNKRFNEGNESNNLGSMLPSFNVISTVKSEILLPPKQPILYPIKFPHGDFVLNLSITGIPNDMKVGSKITRVSEKIFAGGWWIPKCYFFTALKSDNEFQCVPGSTCTGTGTVVAD